MSNLVEELMETIDILENKETLQSIKEADEDIKTGRIRNYNEFVKELKKSGDI